MLMKLRDTKTDYKFNEGALIEELQAYIDKTTRVIIQKIISNQQNLLLIVTMVWGLL